MVVGHFPARVYHCINAEICGVSGSRMRCRAQVVGYVEQAAAINPDQDSTLPTMQVGGAGLSEPRVCDHSASGRPGICLHTHPCALQLRNFYHWHITAASFAGQNGSQALSHLQLLVLLRARRLSE